LSRFKHVLKFYVVHSMHFLTFHMLKKPAICTN